MPIGIMGRKSFTVFTNKRIEGINTFVGAVSLYVAESPKASIKDYQTPLPIIPFGIVAYGFVGRPFSKLLYTDWLYFVWHGIFKQYTTSFYG